MKRDKEVSLMSIMEASPTKESDLFKGVSQRVVSEIGKMGRDII